MKIVIHEAAVADLEAIFAWISHDSPKAAAAVVRRIRTRINHLARPGLARIGRPGLAPGTRELVEGPYIVVYEIDATAQRITVLAIVHGARDRQD
ncbi:type II toxin-antitoxin system RelE/ParE family toxin [Bradyrhizobium sp. SRS-191]|uniref:type II toxin-antitoxin system RelE/ParE family toxin n=1 Tax=Bradyrhizobium sp. SRS-191 TaxID=2962606 RepID=UPI00211E843C|nr:type II toxin-antitoxin system RelE/ParE family toxin [Bradyrhizobium sp. SRS-191]